MKNIIKLLGLIVFVSITFMACEDQKECKKETSSCDSEKEESCCKKNRETCEEENKKPCCYKKTDPKENESNSDTTQNDVVIGDFVL